MKSKNSLIGWVEGKTENLRWDQVIGEAKRKMRMVNHYETVNGKSSIFYSQKLLARFSIHHPRIAFCFEKLNLEFSQRTF